MDLEKWTITGRYPGISTVLRERRDKRCDTDQPRICKKRSDLSSTPDILTPSIRREPQVRIQAVAQVVAIQQVGRVTGIEQASLETRCERGFSGA